MTNAQKQAAYRARRKAAGLRRKDTWADSGGFIGKPTDEGTWASIPLTELTAQIRKLVEPYEDWEKEVIYAEVLEHAKQVAIRYRKIHEYRLEAEKEAKQDIVTGNHIQEASFSTD
ncbi:hypothetical protein FACS1894163_01330 [Spirochaetia bacterium]|nr:hypothetical protein FACS1894163_01330 [Spirochaetia bacterium]